MSRSPRRRIEQYTQARSNAAVAAPTTRDLLCAFFSAPLLSPHTRAYDARRRESILEDRSPPRAASVGSRARRLRLRGSRAFGRAERLRAVPAEFCPPSLPFRICRTESRWSNPFRRRRISRLARPHRARHYFLHTGAPVAMSDTARWSPMTTARAVAFAPRVAVMRKRLASWADSLRP